MRANSVAMFKLLPLVQLKIGVLKVDREVFIIQNIHHVYDTCPRHLGRVTAEISYLGQFQRYQFSFVKIYLDFRILAIPAPRPGNMEPRFLKKGDRLNFKTSIIMG